MKTDQKFCNFYWIIRYKCNCKINFILFEIISFADIIDCDSNSCNGNGVCVEVKGGGFICKCEPGWKGFNCSVNIDDCKPNPCANGAACIDGLLDYDCICTEGWTGEKCNVGELID